MQKSNQGYLRKVESQKYRLCVTQAFFLTRFNIFNGILVWCWFLVWRSIFFIWIFFSDSHSESRRFLTRSNTQNFELFPLMGNHFSNQVFVLYLGCPSKSNFWKFCFQKVHFEILKILKISGIFRRGHPTFTASKTSVETVFALIRPGAFVKRYKIARERVLSTWLSVFRMPLSDSRKWVQKPDRSDLPRASS